MRDAEKLTSCWEREREIQMELSKLVCCLPVAASRDLILFPLQQLLSLLLTPTNPHLSLLPS